MDAINAGRNESADMTQRGKLKLQIGAHLIAIALIWFWIWYYANHTVFVVWWAWWLAGIITVTQLLSIAVLIPIVTRREP